MSERRELNSDAVIALVLGILSLCTPFIGLVLGILGIVFARKAFKTIEENQEDGRGMAVAGQVCSIVGLILQIFAIIGFIAFYALITVNIMEMNHFEIIDMVQFKTFNL